MLRATKNIMLPTTITGSLPRPSSYTQNFGARSFLDAIVNNQFRDSMSNAVRFTCTNREWRAWILFLTATRISIRMSVARVGLIILRGIWVD